MIEFSLPLALLVYFLSAILPGILISLGILKKSNLELWERIFVGIGIGIIVQGLLPFLEYLFLNIRFSPELAVFNTILLYIVAIAYSIYTKNYEEFLQLKFSLESLKNNLIPIAVILLFFLNFIIRIQTLSPIYQEIDPYYYIYIPYQIITLGYNPFDDKTAWYPDTKVDHRSVPVKAYMEATGYTLYSLLKNEQDKEKIHLILSYYANIFPPLASSLAVFFVYLGLRAWVRKEYAFLSAALLSFIPIFILKLLAGLAEVQPYAFFSISFFFAFFMWVLKDFNIQYIILAGIAYLATSLSTSSEIVLSTTFFIFTIFSSAIYFLTKREIEKILKISVGIVTFSFLASFLKSLYIAALSINYFLLNLSALIFVLILYYIPNYIKESEKQTYALGSLIIIAIALYAFTPLGNIVKTVAKAGLEIAEFVTPLYRTIAEQNVADSTLENMLGFIGASLKGSIIYSILVIFSQFTNYFFISLVFLLNSLFGTNLEYISKEPSIAILIFALFLIFLFWSLFRFTFKNETNPSVFLLALILPVSLIGLIKAKYTIYFGYMLAIAFAFVLQELENIINIIINALKLNFNQYTFFVLFFAAFNIVIFQFLESRALNILEVAFLPRFQDNPALFESKFAELCKIFEARGYEDKEVCEAGNNSIAFANRSLDNQFNFKLCVLSLIGDPEEASESKRIGAAIRCERISSYWINSMEWIRKNTEQDARITSWWDYGHWENYFGLRNAVLRNEHANHTMIGQIAYDFIMGTPEELKRDMKYFGSKYLLLDAELILSERGFGGKFGALNYLACAHKNLTNVKKYPGTSLCEFNNSWRIVYVPTNPSPSDMCDISVNKKGIIGYLLTFNLVNGKPYYSLKPTFCVSIVQLIGSTGLENATSLYILDKKTEDGDLVFEGAYMIFTGVTNNGKFREYHLIYRDDLIWIEEKDGSVSTVQGAQLYKSKFYDSVLYRGFILESLPGFELVYKTPDGAVKIFKIKEENKTKTYP